MDDSIEIPETFFSSSPWKEAREKICPAIAITLHRNIFPYRFPKAMSEAESNQVLEMVSYSLSKSLENSKTLEGNSLTLQNKEYLFEHFILNQGFEKFEEGRAIIIDESAALLGLINVEDHLNLHLFNYQMEWEKSLEQIHQIEQTLAKSLNFAFSNRFGYLTADAKNCGTGLILQAFLHLPALIHTEKFSEISDQLQQKVTIRGLGKESEYVADLVLIENTYKLGVTEEEIVQEVRSACNELIKKEKEAREELKKESSDRLKDKISRAYGLLAHSYSLKIEETLAALSLIELGKEVGWIQGGEELNFHSLFFDCRRAHMQHAFQEKNITKEEMIHKRAQFLHQKLKGSELIL